MEVSLFSSLHHVKILYGDTPTDFQNYVNKKQQGAFYQGGNNNNAVNNGPTRKIVTMSDDQFRRFKTAGRQHATKAPKNTAGPQHATKARKFTPDGVEYTRADRTNSAQLNKWDVDRYENLTHRTAPWGTHSLTNRDHVPADSENQKRLKQGYDPYQVGNQNELKKLGWAVTISGKHHRTASITYGGKVNAKQAHTGGLTQMDWAANNPQAAVLEEIRGLLEWKRLPANHTKGKSTLRIEMVGAYFYLYKKLVAETVINGDKLIDEMLLDYLESAVASDDGKART